MKRWTLLLLSAVLSLALAGTTAAAASASVSASPKAAIHVVLNGQTLSFDTPPVNLDNAIYVPFRPLFAQLGYQVEYDAKTKTVHAVSADHEIQMSIGGDVAFVDGQTVEVAGQLRSQNGLTLVGVRFLAALSGKKVEWLADTRTVQLTDKGPNAEQQEAIFGLFDQLSALENTDDAQQALALFAADSPLRDAVEAGFDEQRNQDTHTEFADKKVLDFDGSTAVVETEEHTVGTGGDYYFANTSTNDYTLHLDAASGKWLIYDLAPTAIEYDDPEPLLNQGVDVPEPDKSAIQALLTAQNDAYNAEDLDAFEATVVPFDGLEDSLDALRSTFAQIDFTFTLGKTAVLSYRADHAVVIQEKIVEYEGQDAKMRLLQGNELVKQDGKWLFGPEEYVLKQEML